MKQLTKIMKSKGWDASTVNINDCLSDLKTLFNLMDNNGDIDCDLSIETVAYLIDYIETVKEVKI